MESDADAYDLIMRDKERLLSLDEPTAFIFSHSALREGWDNPNIFQICTLNRTISTLRKRQEIGRGMRLAVNQAGERVFDDQVNRLTVVANESYQQYCEQLQSEYVEVAGTDQAPPRPKNARKRRTVHLKRDGALQELNAAFKQLWEHVARRTRYRVELDTEALIDACAKAVSGIRVAPITVRTERVQIEGIRDRGMLDYTLQGQAAVEVERDYEIPNVAAELAEITHLTRRTIRAIVTRAGNLDQVFRNPADYLQQVGDAINAAKRRFLVDGVQYQETDHDLFDMSLLDDFEAYEDAIVPVTKSIYDAVVVDSQVERDFALALERLGAVKLFVKLPDWFTVPTPIGAYNPDWAILAEREDPFGEHKETLYLVRETKGTLDPEQRRGTENMRIACAKRHFETLDVDYADVVSAEGLLGS
jgi:type III restriction enzyme